MKNLKKALALVVASVSVFGTIASANTSFVNKATINYNLLTSGGSHESLAWIGRDGHTLTKQEDGSIVFTSNATSLLEQGLNQGGGMTTYFLNRGSYNYDVGHKAFRISSRSKTEAVMEFSLRKTANKKAIYTTDSESNEVLKDPHYIWGDCGNISLLGVGYTSGSTEAILGTGLDIKKVYWDDTDNLSAELQAGSSKGEMGKMQHKMRLTTVFDPTTGIAESKMIDTEDNNREVFTWTTKLPEGATFKYVDLSTYIRFKSIYDITIYNYTINREAVVTKDASVVENAGTLTATVKAASNTDSGVCNKAESKNAIAILAQYDANDRMLDCAVGSVGTMNSVAPNSDIRSVASLAEYVTLTASASKANGYSYSKVFVWDGADTMNPFAEVYSTKAD